MFHSFDMVRVNFSYRKENQAAYKMAMRAIKDANKIQVKEYPYVIVEQT